MSSVHYISIPSFIRSFILQSFLHSLDPSIKIKRRTSIYLFTFLAMGLELPDDDDGGLDFTLSSVKAVAKPLPKKCSTKGVAKVKATAKTKSSKPKKIDEMPKSNHATGSHDDQGGLGLDLPSDDSDGLFFDQAPPPAPVPKKRPRRCPAVASSSATLPGVAPTDPGTGGELLDWDAATLVQAASHIPSTVDMPYLDLKQAIQKGYHVSMDAESRCDLWEIYSCPRMGPVMREMGGKSARSYDLVHFWNLNEEGYQRVLIQDVALCRPKFLMLSPHALLCASLCIATGVACHLVREC